LAKSRGTVPYGDFGDVEEGDLLVSLEEGVRWAPRFRAVKFFIVVLDVVSSAMDKTIIVWCC
jgi:hypothetical protein